MESVLQETVLDVNSLHSQGIDRLGQGLRVEAKAPDGLVEAVSIEQMSFGLAVQWHPEWEVLKHPKQKQLFEAFGQACQTQQAK